jgi:hypothetical protein
MSALMAKLLGFFERKLTAFEIACAIRLLPPDR